MPYSKMTLEQLLDEYFYMRRDADNFFNECYHPEVFAEIERRTFHE
jgi:hypothetical protein